MNIFDWLMAGFFGAIGAMSGIFIFKLILIIIAVCNGIEVPPEVFTKIGF